MSFLPFKSSSPHVRGSSSHKTITPSSNHDASNISFDLPVDARRIVSLSQCPQCSRVLQEPISLPCGNTLCRKCIPETHLRKNISYPATANRLHGFTCPFAACKLEHTVGDCSVNVALKKVLDLVRIEMQKTTDSEGSSEVLSEEVNDTLAVPPITGNDVVHVRTPSGGKMATMYAMAESGQLDYSSDVTYSPDLPEDVVKKLDERLTGRLKDIIRTELDCHICFGLLLEPLTLACGHTFCRSCLDRVLDHSSLCPVCRRPVSISMRLTRDAARINLLFSKIISTFCPEALAARAATAELDERNLMGEHDTPLFICTLSFPSMPTFLHIFEPRYRLMMRRAMEFGDRKFGMLLHNPHRRRQGDLGQVPFYHYGTLLNIENMQILPDGRSLIEAVGVSRFRVLSHDLLDGYAIGKVERIDDISLAAEEALEASETRPSSPSLAHRPPSIEEYSDASPQQSWPTPPSSQESIDASPLLVSTSTIPPVKGDIDRIATQDLLDICVKYVEEMQSRSAPWLHLSACHAYGACPTNDPKKFPWWFASVIPMASQERYRLLGTTSVRERLKLCVSWVRALEAGPQRPPSSYTLG